MKWVITEDLINLPGEGVPSRVGRGNFPLSEARSLPYEFRLKDDDGEIYYIGRCGNIENADEDAAFAPLDFGEADAGCTTLEYRRGRHPWRVL